MSIKWLLLDLVLASMSNVGSTDSSSVSRVSSESIARSASSSGLALESCSRCEDLCAAMLVSPSGGTTDPLTLSCFLKVYIMGSLPFRHGRHG